MPRYVQALTFQDYDGRNASISSIRMDVREKTNYIEHMFEHATRGGRRLLLRLALAYAVAAISRNVHGITQRGPHLLGGNTARQGLRRGYATD